MKYKLDKEKMGMRRKRRALKKKQRKLVLRRKELLRKIKQDKEAQVRLLIFSSALAALLTPVHSGHNTGHIGERS